MDRSPKILKNAWTGYITYNRIRRTVFCDTTGRCPSPRVDSVRLLIDKITLSKWELFWYPNGVCSLQAVLGTFVPELKLIVIDVMIASYRVKIKHARCLASPYLSTNSRQYCILLRIQLS